ncbi:dipeptidase [Chondrinema litorale]|uniref:dipeptidase n=1 Tax=Chondrinema litorale TaxID=2994555 RepID=UPI002544A199|nr:dipeptidase [Chondrinema litorale]UZR94903.1 dipeptidase [Chondrinema litorale]
MLQYIESNKERFLSELFDLLRIPSISTDKKYKDDVIKAAEFLKNKLSEAGADNAELCATPGYPIVFAEKIIDEKLPTVLVYGHYDVQPADPLSLWTTPPFEPEIREGKIYARGACDDKGQTYMHVKAFETMMKNGTLPCNIKFMLEGEEESGSEHLEGFVTENKDKIAADVILISDTGIIANDVPAITVGLRGMSYMEVEVTGPNRDLHSGLYGGGVPNPINVLTKMIASLTDDEGKITIPGFYEKVEVLSDAQRAELAKAPFDQAFFKSEIGLKDVQGEKGYSTPERVSIRPTLDVNGIWGGYMEEGAKTVIPSKAHAKISMRLVPFQEPEEITEIFTKHFESIAPESVSVKVIPHHGGDPAVIPTDSVAYKAASKAMETTFGKTPVPVRSGGSIPIVAMFKEQLGLDSILMGFGLDSDAIHSPNEHYGVFNFMKGIETIPYFYQYYAEMMKS